MNIKALWEYIQDLLDVRGDVIMMIMSSAFVLRVLLAGIKGHPALNANEAALYASAIASFAYSNKGPKSS